MSADFTAAIHESPDDEVAWDAWFREIYPRVLYSAVRRASGDVELAEEATQGAMECFLRYRAFERVDSDRSAITYLVPDCGEADDRREKAAGPGVAGPGEDAGAGCRCPRAKSRTTSSSRCFGIFRERNGRYSRW